MSNITIHPAIASNPLLLAHLQTATNSVATIAPGQRFATLVPKTPQIVPITSKNVPSRTWLKTIGERALEKDLA